MTEAVQHSNIFKSMKDIRFEDTISHQCGITMRNLKLHWMAAGDAWPPPGLDDAIELANLGDAIDRKVRGYSQGM